MCFESAKRVINIYNTGKTLKKSKTSRHIFRAQVKWLNHGAWCCVDLPPLELWQVPEWQVIPLKCQTSLIFLATFWLIPHCASVHLKVLVHFSANPWAWEGFFLSNERLLISLISRAHLCLIEQGFKECYITLDAIKHLFRKVPNWY